MLYTPHTDNITYLFMESVNLSRSRVPCCHDSIKCDKSLRCRGVTFRLTNYIIMYVYTYLPQGSYSGGDAFFQQCAHLLWKHLRHLQLGLPVRAVHSYLPGMGFPVGSCFCQIWKLTPHDLMACSSCRRWLASSP